MTACTRQTELNSKECTRHLLPVRDALDVLTGKWKIPIIIALSFGNVRFRELHRELGITPKMLSKELKDLEMHGLVQRTVAATTPVTVSYSLTSYADTLTELIQALKKWGEQHREKMMPKNETDRANS
jgi:DNA-binding HxlR family transcriptional regulator